MRWSGRQSSLGGVPITGICLVRYGKPGLAEPIHCGDRGGTGNPGVAVPDFYLAGLSRAGRLGVGLRFFCHGA